MDTIIDTPTTDIVITDEAVMVEDNTNTSFAKETGKTLATSIATSAGLVVGAALVGYAYGKIVKFKARRSSKAETVLEGEIVNDVTTETPETEK